MRDDAPLACESLSNDFRMHRPTLILPPVIMTMLAKRNLFTGPNGKRIEAVTHLGLIGTALLVFLPVGLSVELAVSHS